MITSVRRLTELFAPSLYTLRLDLTQRVARTFSGTVTIKGTLTYPGKEIILHSKGLEIVHAAIDSQPVQTEAGADDELILLSEHELAAGEHALALTFTGTITDTMQGLYPCYFTHEGKTKELLMTQLESHYAREVFPCVDEPAAKAVFRLTLLTEPGITVLSNTPIATQGEQKNALVTHFKPTPRMSPYLLAFVTGELGYLETKNKHGVTVRTYATPDKIEQTGFALEFAARVLDYYDDYFAMPYPLPKCDMVAVPDFSAGAMENWGLITYREAAMLLDPKHASADTKEYIAIVIAHELSHQWFGNLVTMQWWDDLWLNESFANFMEHIAVDHFYPEWQVWEQFSSGERQYAFNRDGLAEVQAVKQPVHHPDELNGLFDAAIVYAKGSCLLRMLHGYLGADVFRDGLRAYMRQYAYRNTSASDLWKALADVSGKNIAAFMDPWLQQPGHPVLTVHSTKESTQLSQRRFYANPTEKRRKTNDLWPIPLLSPQIPTETLEGPSMTVPATNNEKILVNDGYTGFYHTQYESAQLAQLARLIDKQKLPATTRLGLLADNLALAKAGLIATTDLLALLQHYGSETTYPVWQSIFAVIGALRMIIDEDPELKPFLKRYIHSLVAVQFERLGWQPVDGEPYFDQLLRPDIISLMAYAEVPAVTQHILELFDNAERPEALLADIRTTIYAVAVRERGEPAFEQLLTWYQQTSSSEERINIATGITAVKDELLALRLTTYFTTRMIKPQDLFYWFINLMRNRYGKDVTWQWMQSNWEWIKTQYKGGQDYADFPKYAASSMSTREQLKAYTRFFEPKLQEPELAMVIRQSIEDIEIRALWRERDFAGVSDFLKQQAA